MKNLNEAHGVLTDLKYELDLHRNSLGQKLEYISTFVDQNLDDVVDEVSNAIDRIAELEAELAEANDRIGELESEKE